jgi:drug/metabolite transporter (DMT)-like permease
MNVAVKAPPSERDVAADRRLTIGLALFALYVIWGSTYFAMKVALETLPPFLMAGPRFLFGGLVMYVWLRNRGHAAPTREQWIASAKIASLLLVIGNGAVAIAQHLGVASSTSAVVVASMPIWAAFFARIYGLRSSGREWIGLLLGFAGVIMLKLGGALTFNRAALVLLAAPLAWAFGSVWMKRLPLPNGVMATSTQMITGGVMMLCLAGITGERLHHLPSLRSTLAALYLMVFGSIVAFTAYNWLLRNVRPALATSYAYVNPIVALLLGAYLGGEPVGALTIGAAAVSLLGVALISKA